jgi:hypothetical protein
MFDLDRFTDRRAAVLMEHYNAIIADKMATPRWR